jgi:CBS domain-containing protein
MPEPRSVLKRTTIREVERVLDIEPTIVRAGDDLIDVARQAFGRPSTRVLSVVDDDGRLVGILPVLRVVEEIVARAAPEQLLADISTVEQAARFAEEVSARTAGQLMLAPVFLRLDDTVSVAFAAMHVHHLSGLPVLDEDRQVVGYVDVLELALRYLAELRPPEASHGP